MSAATNISLARGAPSLDIIAVDELRAAAQRAFERDPAGAFSYGTSAGYPRLVAWIAEKHGVEPDQVIATNGSMQADAFLFEQLVGPGDLVVVEAPTYDRTLLALRNLGAEILAIPLEPDGIDVGALEQALEAGARPRLAHIIPNFQNPAGCTLSLDKRRRLLELAARVRLHDLRGRPVRGAALRGRGPAHDAVARRARQRRLRVVVLEDGVPGHPGGLPGGPRRHDRLDPQDWPRAPTSRRAWSPRRSWPSSATSGAIDGSIETVKAALRERRDATAAALERHLPDARFVTPEGGYFLWVDLPEGTDVAAIEKAATRARRGVREGHGLPARGRRELASHRLLGGAAGADRGGHRPHGGGPRRGTPESVVGPRA